ncbi:unnamed protein product [Brassicogethes aeneus]|uniref:NIF3-like protein 1 n=1 Tax=Brassicogethes aeneus TaxID=1431903 RepID=A0A9P0B2J8_BRAAE|nr:unnamed protein product [Brassicogethes aeneus]
MHTNSLSRLCSVKNINKTTNIIKNYTSGTMGVPLNNIVKKLTAIAPLNLAGTWDNVGMLVEPTSNKNIDTALLTIDLTEDVVDEAIRSEAQLIISYHPNIFQPLKKVTQSHWKQRVVIKCIKNDIAVFSPHTSWDSISGGVNDWLGSVFETRESAPIEKNENDPTIGMGRLLTLKKPMALDEIIFKVKIHVGIEHLRVAVARHKGLDSLIHTVALCAGSGASILNGINADLYLTGEMMHHDVLDAAQKGTHVILTNHSDSERGFLRTIVDKIKMDNLNVLLSEVDKDCLKTM